MNSIRWMPMIRWLKFPFRVHILHKTVQLSVHELWGGCVRNWLKACPTVPPSNSEKGAGWHFLKSSVSAFHSHNPAPISFFFFLTLMKGLVQSGYLAFCAEKAVVCNSHSFFLFNDVDDRNHLLSAQNRRREHTSEKFPSNSNMAYNMHTLSVVQYKTSLWASE